MGRNLILAIGAGAVAVLGLNAAAPSEHAPSPQAPRHAGWMAHGMNTRHAWLYATGYSTNSVDIYDLSAASMPKIGEIEDGITNPDGIAIDTNGTLYVADSTIDEVRSTGSAVRPGV